MIPSLNASTVLVQNLPALQVVLPLFAAPLCLFMRPPRLAWLFALAVAGATFAIAVVLTGTVQQVGAFSYEMGGWAAPWGIEYVIDPLDTLMLCLVTGIALLVLIYAGPSVEAEIPRRLIPQFYVLYLLCLTGLLGMVATGDVFNLFVFLEISSLSSYALVAMGRDPRALTAAYRYLILGSLGATFYVIGIGLLYMMTGTLNMEDLARRLPEVADTRTISVAIAFLAVGLSLKLALFPLHKWLPGAYTHAPSVVTAFLAATATKVAVYVLVRIFFTVLGPIEAFQTLPVAVHETQVVSFLAIVAMLSGSAVAIFQPNLKRLFAYSSIAQIGYMMLGISMVSVTGMTAGLVHMVNHAMMKGVVFMALGAIVLRVGRPRIERLDGIGYRMPVTFAAFLIAALSLIGVPGTVGFISKLYLIKAALADQHWIMAAAVVVSSCLAIIYIWRILEVAYMRSPPADAPKVREAPLVMLVPLCALALANVYFGLDTRYTVGLADSAAEFILNYQPDAGPAFEHPLFDGGAHGQAGETSGQGGGHE
ncbi:monovalent cation/H+ antiporter subunit D family protein [Roseospira marina]|uniref:Monovalent cation/H+ antiporter subunit D family protein n=1 Tax=Roseospira marina TaxID=140057 RepID=A0A5M6IGF7_9PROT|nr:monovalent cation/H+ antiporter subunit D family protein [Roseospira marina]KAA5607391.1 monovalent cation/H+ antiporter subunit D family protein [Roseospira marina]MBB4312438.1 multicomponent Na+:H+ antiporter subunit D [Roseospira marina]MBB5085546.1 multicomponent Na+:H+ antiporter subunit D [Roseospira marina]